MLWFYALGAGLLNAIAHFVFPIVKGGYFPGLYTATGNLILSALLIVFLLWESRGLRAPKNRPDGSRPPGALVPRRARVAYLFGRGRNHAAT